jgi:hypothetical protein
MDTATGQKAGVEWGDGGDNAPAPLVEKDNRGWPILHADDPCDGVNPMTGRLCTRNYHRGCHHDVAGAEWLDDE